MSIKSAKLLIVDDKPATRLSISAIFTGLGHRVRTAEDGFSALLEIRYNPPDILLSDLNMPGMSGFELLSVVRRRFPRIHVVAMSGHFPEGGFQPGVAADAFYEKGVDLQALLEVVEIMSETQAELSSPHRCAPVPIWLHLEADKASGSPFATLACPECLRTFPVRLSTSEALIHEAACVYCANLVLYALHQPRDPTSPQSFQRNRLTEQNQALPN